MKSKMQKSWFEKLLWKINDQVFNWQLTDIIEVTYAYKEIWDWKYWNETLFGYFSGFRYDNSINLENVYCITEEKLTKTIKRIEGFIEKNKKILFKDNSEKIKSSILEWSLIYAWNCLKMALLWLPFEAEKAWRKHDFTDLEVLKIIKYIEKLEKKNFWGKILDNEIEISLAYNYVLKVFREWKHLLNVDEQKNFKSRYISYMKSLLSEELQSFRVNYNYSHTIYSPDIEVKLNTKLTRKKYSKFFLVVLNDILWLDFQVVHEERSSIYDGPWFLAFPTWSNYNHMTLKQVIELIWHEVEVHSYNYRMNECILWNFRWAGNLEKEEWFAMTVEEFLKWRKLSEITVTRHFVIVFASEIFSPEDFNDFMKMYSKLTWRSYTIQNLLRQKRNYPLWYKWGQHKDVTYGRWIRKVISFLKTGWDMRELYLWKVSLDDIPKIKKLLKYKWVDIWDLNIPIFLWELLMYLAVTPEKSSNCTNFSAYLKKKYHFVNFKNLDLLILKEFVRVKVRVDSLKLLD